MRLLDANIPCVSEMHLIDKKILIIKFRLFWAGYNRQEIHRTAPKACSGVCISIKESTTQMPVTSKLSITYMSQEISKGGRNTH